MRKGSTVLGSLGWISAGIVLLILPLDLAGPALPGGASPAAADEVTPPGGEAAVAAAAPAAPAATIAGYDTGAIREALKQRRWWMVRPVALASRRPARRPSSEVLRVIRTRATWYGPGFHGRRTASGERFNRNAMTLASRHLPFGTRVRVVNLKNGRTAVARVNDRGPFGRRGYTADLSQGLARRIGLSGSGPIKLEILKHGRK